MLRNRLYYALKPLLPRNLRLRLRRWWTVRKRKQVGNVWPILPGSEKPPAGWKGWPSGHKFAFVLTHDVEGLEGLHQVRPLKQLEMELGFRSSFNFIPEGSYATPKELRKELADEGFEVGVHDLKHDGFLYRSRSHFDASATQINRYLEEWDAVGFRSGFMFHNLEWLQALNIAYDASTFDTDPFEPQPEGRKTIFPFWVSKSKSANGHAPSKVRHGFLELPYTLPQDSTLFLLLREQNTTIWKAKLDWIAAHGGMALVNIHPDYVAFGSEVRPDQYPAKLIRDFLEYVEKRYKGDYWNPCPRELVRWMNESSPLAGANGAAADASSTGDSSKLPLKHEALRGKRAAVLLYSYYPADPRPRRAAEAMIEAGMEVDLLCLREKESDPARECVNGVNVQRVSIRKRRGSKLGYLWQYGRFLWSSFWFLMRRTFRRRHDVVHVHNMPDILAFAAIPQKLMGSRLILDLHDPMPELMTTIYGLKPSHLFVRMLRMLERWSIALANVALTPNIAFKKLFVSRSCKPDKVQIVMNSPNQKIFDPDLTVSPSPSSAPTDEFRIMHHGEIVHRHGIDLLVEAVARVRAEIPTIRLDIYGSKTPFLDTVLEVARRTNVAEIVHYHGAKSQPEIARAIRNCHLGVVPNRHSVFTEINFPTRIFEFLSMHRPVIAPATSGIRDYFAPDELLSFSPGSVDDLANRILWVRNHPTEVEEIVARGIAVYRKHLWSREKAKLLDHVAAVLN
jgi:glycosyltransferase involved in cell wall biosynthesis